MNEKLNVIATQLLEPETEGGPSSLLIVLGNPPNEAVVAYISSSRSQVTAIFQSLNSHVDEGQVQNILTVMRHFDSFPEESEELVEVLEDLAAQVAFDRVDLGDADIDEGFWNADEKSEDVYSN